MPTIAFVRLYADAAGETHFADEAVDLEAVQFAPPAPPINLSPFAAATQTALIVQPPGWFGDWHPAPLRQFMFRLAGEVEVRVSDGEVRRFGPGTILLLEDTTGKGHTTRVLREALTAVVQVRDTGGPVWARAASSP